MARATSNRFAPLEANQSPPLGESTGKVLNVVSPIRLKPSTASSSKATPAKGTPNAGKLLKKATTLAATEKVPPVPKVIGDAGPGKSRDAKGKGKARK